MIQQEGSRREQPPVLACAVLLLRALRTSAPALLSAGAAISYAALRFELDWLSVPPEAATVPVAPAGAALASLQLEAAEAPPWAVRVLPPARAACAGRAAAAAGLQGGSMGPDRVLTLFLPSAGVPPPSLRSIQQHRYSLANAKY